MTVLAVVGPTASGKSRLALQAALSRMAAGRPTELVAVDAFTIYRGMDIGTAKPDPDERLAVSHHLIDRIDPDAELSVVAFRDLARVAIAEVRDRGATPILVGGSGLYFRAVVDPLRFPPTDAAVRARIGARWSGDAGGAHAHLTDLDPAAARRIDPANLRRTVRALEVVELTGRPFSAFDDSYGRYESIYPDLEVVLLDPPTGLLRASIDERARRMVERGLLGEMAALRARGPLSRTAAQAIGYAEAAAVLNGTLPAAELANAIARRTWRYARRQRGWFRADPRCRPLGVGEAHRELVRA